MFIFSHMRLRFNEKSYDFRKRFDFRLNENQIACDQSLTNKSENYDTCKNINASLITDLQFP